MSEPTKNNNPSAIFSECNELLGKPRCFVVRKSDGMFYRGARLWQWTKNWRHAALLDEDFVRGWLFANGKGRLNENEVLILTASFSMPNA